MIGYCNRKKTWVQFTQLLGYQCHLKQCRIWTWMNVWHVFCVYEDEKSLEVEIEQVVRSWGKMRFRKGFKLQWRNLPMLCTSPCQRAGPGAPSCDDSQRSCWKRKLRRTHGIWNQFTFEMARCSSRRAPLRWRWRTWLLTLDIRVLHLKEYS